MSYGAGTGAIRAPVARPVLRLFGEAEHGRVDDSQEACSTLRNAIFVFAMIQTVWLIWYFCTGSGGPQELVARVMSIALILQILFMYQDGDLYKFLPRARQPHHRRDLYRHLRLRLHHFYREFEEIAI